MEQREKNKSVRGDNCGPKCVFTSRALVERAVRSRRADRDAPNESSVAQTRAELWPDMCFCPYGALLERTGRSRRADRDAPNESSGAQLRAELWPETCFCTYGALVARTGRSCRADRDAPNESSVAQLRAEFWPETCFDPTCIQNVKAASMVFLVASDDHPCMHFRPTHPCFGSCIHPFSEPLDGAWMEQRTKT